MRAEIDDACLGQTLGNDLGGEVGPLLAGVEDDAVGGDDDVNVVSNVSAILEYDGAGGTSYLSNSGDLVAGQTIQNLVPAITADHYYYLTAGTGDTAAAYTAGMYALRTYGRALLA